MEVLIVDDLEHSRISLARIVAHFGCTPLEAQGVKQAFAILKRHPGAGAVLLRARKGVVFGHDLIAQLKAREEGSTPRRVIVVGKEEDMPAMLKLLAEGADEYIIKPFDRDMIGRKMAAIGACC